MEGGGVFPEGSVNVVRVGLSYLGRVFLSVVFLFSAIIEILNWSETENYYTMIFTRWMYLYRGNEEMSLYLAELLTWLPTVLTVGIALRILGGVLMVVGVKVRLGAFFLLLFLLAETVAVYDFWHLTGPEQTCSMLLFFKNVAIFGGLMIVLSYGKGTAPIKSSD